MVKSVILAADDPQVLRAVGHVRQALRHRCAREHRVVRADSRLMPIGARHLRRAEAPRRIGLFLPSLSPAERRTIEG